MATHFDSRRLMNSCQYGDPMSRVKGRADDRAVRGYHSPVRDERALRTRHVILLAANDLFLERGFARCAVADIARAAGVARPTVLSVFESKAALLRAVVDLAMAGDAEPVPISERSWFLPVWEAATAEACLDAYAHAVVRIGRQSADVIELVRRAADESPANAEIWDQLQANRRRGAGTIVDRVHELGGLPRGLTRRRATDLLFVLNDSGHYRTLVRECGWSERAFESWLSDRMRHALLRHPAV
jgi:AcrR family transcriptional regulator